MFYTQEEPNSYVAMNTGQFPHRRRDMKLKNVVLHVGNDVDHINVKIILTHFIKRGA